MATFNFFNDIKDIDREKCEGHVNGRSRYIIRTYIPYIYLFCRRGFGFFGKTINKCIDFTGMKENGR